MVIIMPIICPHCGKDIINDNCFTSKQPNIEGHYHWLCFKQTIGFTEPDKEVRVGYFDKEKYNTDLLRFDQQL